MEGDVLLYWEQMVACSREDTVQEQEVGQVVHQQVAALICSRVDFKLFAIPLGVKAPSVLVLRED